MAAILADTNICFQDLSKELPRQRRWGVRALCSGNSFSEGRHS